MEKKSLFWPKFFVFIVVFLMMLQNVEHSVYVYYNSSQKQLERIFGVPNMDWYHAVAVVLVIDLAILGFVYFNRIIEAAIYEVLAGVVQLLYNDWPGYFEPIVYLRIAQLIFAFQFGYGVISYAKIFSGLLKGQQKEADLAAQNIGLAAELEKAAAELKSLAAQKEMVAAKLEMEAAEAFKAGNTKQLLEIQLAATEKELKELKSKQAAEVTCPYCNRKDFLSKEAKNAHMNKCSENPKNIKALTL
ncbi:MAG: hypothetical protein ACK40G_13765 [Cytophagaceae bacterium]